MSLALTRAAAAMSVGMEQKFLANWNDLTFSRASEASFYDGGAFTRDAAARAESVLDGNASNLWPDPGSETWSASTNSPVITTGIAGPWGSNDAITVEDTGTGYQIAANDTLIDPGSSTALLWCFAVKATSGASYFTEIQLYEGATQHYLFNFDQETGAWNKRAGAASADTVEVVRIGDWWVCSLEFASGTFTGGTANLETRVHGAAGTTYPTIAAATAGTTTFWGPLLLPVETYAEQRANNPRAWALTDEPRVFADGSILIEGARTNLIADSEDMSAWTGTNGVVATGGEAAADGADDAYLLDDPGGNLSYITADTASLGAAAHVLSVFIGQDADTSRFPEIHIRAGTGTLSGGVIGIHLNTSTGATATRSGSPDFVRVADLGDRWLVQIGFTMSGAGTATLRLYPAFETSIGGTSDTAATGSIVPWGVQVEEGSWPTSPIRTDGATATRPVEVAYLDGADIDTRALDSAFAVDFWPAYDVADRDDHAIMWSTGNDYLRFAANWVFNANGVNLLTTSATGGALGGWSHGDKVTVEIDWVAGTFRTYVNGVVDIDTTFTTGNDWSTNVPSDTTVYIGNDGSGRHLDGRISRWRAL